MRWKRFPGREGENPDDVRDILWDEVRLGLEAYYRVLRRLGRGLASDNRLENH